MKTSVRCLILAGTLHAATALAATFTVTVTNDSGLGTLRQAILDSNASVSSSNNVIAFNIAGAGLHTIQLSSALPAFSQAVTIDGFTQPFASANTLANGNNANWLIELRGVGAAFLEKTLRLNIAGTIVRGLRISGSKGLGIEMVSSNCVVAGCFIYSNGAGGITLYDGHANRIGGAVPAERNVISGHGGSRGIEISYASGNVILGNFIGPDLAGGNTLGAQFNGVSIFGGSGNMIGDGTIAGGNVIAFHSADAVSVQSETNNTVRGNRIFANGFGIDLWFDGVDANDAGDEDEGANHVQNFPVLTNATAGAGSTMTQGALNSRANTAYMLDFYADTACGASGHGQGEFYLGSAEVTTDGSGNAAFAVTIPITAQGAFITATATDPAGNTSEFSACRQAMVSLPPQTFTVINTNDSGPGSLRQMILDTALVANVGEDRIHFNIPGVGPHRINLLSALPSPAEPLVIDGFTQPGATANTSASNDNAVIQIQIDGAQMGFDNALVLTNGNNLIRGLSFTRISNTALWLQSASNVVAGNWIGIDPAGAPAGNGLGVVINRATNLLGGTNLAARNIISANSFGGLWINGAGASNNLVAGNYIGPGAARTNDLGNSGSGVRIIGNATGNTIGGFDFAAGNVIAFNQEYGVSVESGRQNGIFNNLMTANGLKNIRIAPGANDGIQPPVLTQAYTGSVVVEGSFHGLPNTTYRLEGFLEVLVSFFGQTEIVPLGHIEVTTDEAGNVEFADAFSSEIIPFSKVRTTISCENNTSEESNIEPVVPGNSADLGVALQGPTSGGVGQTNTYTITVTNWGPVTATGVLVEFGFPPTLNIISASSSQGSCTVSNGIIECPLPTLAEGQTVTLTVTAKPTSSAPLFVTARARADQPDAFSPDNLADLDFSIAPITNRFDLVVTPDFIPFILLRRGETGTWISRVANDGPEAVAGVTSYHYLPPGARPLVSMTSTKGICFPNATPPRCEVDNLAPGESYEVTIVFPVGDLAGSQFCTSVHPLEGDVIPGNNAGWKPVLDVEPSASVPTIGIKREPNGAVTTYFPSMAGFGFQTKSELDAPWEAVPTSEVMQENDTFFYTFPMSALRGFARVAEAGVPLPHVDVFQESLDLGFVNAPFSDWGRVELAYESQATLRYFNFAYENNWVIRNVPVGSLETGKVEKLSFNFPLGQYGVIVPNATYGFTLTTNPATQMPANASLGPVAPSLVFRRSGIAGQPLTYWPAQPWFGGMAGTVAKSKPSFPNREQGINECVPAAILNSLEYLNEGFSLGIPASELTMDNMKAASGWTPDGAPSPGFGQLNWYDLKRNYMAVHGLPIKTEFTTNVLVAMEALQNCFAVELSVCGHAAVVREITAMNDPSDPGNYAMTLSDDREQGTAGGTEKRRAIYRPARRTVGGDLLQGFVIQSPSP